jgi:hypothetical protein
MKTMNTTNLIEKLASDGKAVNRLEPLPIRFLSWLVVAVLMCVLSVAIFGIRADMRLKFTDTQFYFESLALLAMGLWAAWESLRLSVPGPAIMWPRWAAVGAGATWILLVASRLFSENPQHPCIDHHFVCALIIMGISLIPNFLLFHRIRQAFPLNTKIIGPLAGISSAAVATLGIQFICAHDGPIHLLSWHLIPSLLSGFIGFLGHSLLLKKSYLF